MKMALPFGLGRTRTLVYDALVDLDANRALRRLCGDPRQATDAASTRERVELLMAIARMRRRWRF